MFAVLIARRFPFAVWSPVYGIPGVYLVLGVAGYLYYRSSASYVGGFYDVGVPRAELGIGLGAFIVAAAACMAGSLVYLALSRRLRRVNPSSTQLRGNLRRPSSYRKGKRPGSALVFVVGLPLLLIVVGKGASNILRRPEYLVEQHHYVFIIGNLLAMPAVLALGLMTMTTRRWRWRVVFGGLFATYWLLFLSLSTRVTAVIFLFFVLGLALGGARRTTVVVLIGLWATALPVLLSIPLALRGMPEQGLEVLPSNLVRISLATPNIEYSQSVGWLVRNVSFGVPLAAYVRTAPPIPRGVFATSLSPMPSFVSVAGFPSWKDVQDQVRVNRYIPYSAIGELLNQGWYWLVLYYFVIGLVAGWMDLGARVFEGHRRRPGYLIACGLLLYFAITSTEYNLRSSTRLVYYAIVIAVLWQLLSRLRIRAARHRLRPHAPLLGGHPF